MLIRVCFDPMEVGEWAFFSGWVHFFKIMVLHVHFTTTFASDLTTCIMSVDIVMSACTLIPNLEKNWFCFGA